MKDYIFSLRPAVQTSAKSGRDTDSGPLTFDPKVGANRCQFQTFSVVATKSFLKMVTVISDKGGNQLVDDA